MNITELKEFIKNSEYIDTPHFQYDSCGNKEQTVIYKNVGKLYEIYYNEDVSCEHYEKGKGWIKGEYKPILVERVSRMVEEISYIHVEESQQIDTI